MPARLAHRTLIACAIVAAIMLSAAITASAAPPPVVKRPSASFSSPDNCGCHGQYVDTWKKSMHAKALSDPIYQAKLAQGQKETGGKLGNFCNTCHGPVAVMSGEIDGTDQSKLSSVSAAAVSCDFCHQVEGSRLRPPRDASYKMSTDGKRHGPLTDAKAPHPWTYSAFFKSSEFCGNCHNVTHPFNGTHLETSYSEWKASPYAAKGINCQDCHMTPGPGVTKPNPGQVCATGPTRQMVYTMTWAGGNVALGDAELAEANLKAAATVDITAPETVGQSGTAEVTATITNVGAGHDLPTGLTEVRQMWVEVVATDRTGKELGRSRHDYGTVLKDAKGKHPVEMWNAAGIYSDDRIPPLESRDVTLTVPVSADQAAKVTATLYYRTASPEIAHQSGVDIPTTTMAATETVVYGSPALAAAAASAGASPAQAASSVADPSNGQMTSVLLLAAAALVIAVGALIWWVALRIKS